MKRLLIVAAVACATAVAFAQSDTRGNGAPKGKFEKFLLVAPGNPNNVQDEATNFLRNDGSNGRAIFIPVRTANGPNEVFCGYADGTGWYIEPDKANANLGDVEPRDGVKINFVKDLSISSLLIADRDATDGYAEIRVPADWANATSIDLYMRVLGKPGGCIGADAFVYEAATYYYAGTAVFKRKAGQSMFVDASELTNVYYCPGGSTYQPTTGNAYSCVLEGGGTTAAIQYNVFNAVFDGYFWDVNNAGVRVTQVLMRANF